MKSLNEISKDAKIYLRILTKKSKIGMGEYSNLEIQYFLEKREHEYLRRTYFNQERISFTEEILNELGIIKEYKIKKPGINYELGKKLEEKIREKEGLKRKRFRRENWLHKKLEK